jgi:Domain of unknown function (DUF4333)
MWRLIPLCLLVAVFAGCGDDPVVLDHGVVENGIEAGIAQQQHVLATVACPPDIEAHEGGKFVCTATLASGRQLPVDVEMTDDTGNVSYSGFQGFSNGHPSG